MSGHLSNNPIPVGKVVLIYRAVNAIRF